MCLQMRRSAKESGHSLEFNGPLQMREHSFLVIRRIRGLWTDSAADRDFTPLCCTITCVHLRCTEKAYSCSLEFCLGGFIIINRKSFVQFCSSGRSVYCLSLVCLVCFVFLSFHSQHFPKSKLKRLLLLDTDGKILEREERYKVRQ